MGSVAFFREITFLILFRNVRDFCEFCSIFGRFWTILASFFVPESPKITENGASECSQKSTSKSTSKKCPKSVPKQHYNFLKPQNPQNPQFRLMPKTPLRRSHSKQGVGELSSDRREELAWIPTLNRSTPGRERPRSDCCLPPRCAVRPVAPRAGPWWVNSRLLLQSTTRPAR